MAAIREELILYDKFTKTFTSYIRLSEQAAGATSKARKSIDQFTRSQKQAEATTSSLTGSLKGLVGAYLSFQSIRGLLDMSDQISQTTARLDMMNDGLQTTAELNDMIYQSAMRARGSYTETAAFVAKLGTLAGNAFDSNAEIVAFAEQINKQMVLSGTTTQEAQGAMLQLTQGLASGALRGEELNSVLEQAPMIAQTIANYMGVSVGEMRELASEGKITAEVVKNAMFAAAEETNAKFDDMPKTWGQVWNEIQNIALKELQPLFDALSDLANSDFIQTGIKGLGLVFRGAGAAAQFLADNIEIIGPILAIAAGALLGYNAAAWLATAAQWALNAAQAANPVGLVVAAIVVLIGVLIWAWDSFEGFRDFLTGFWAAEAKAVAWFYNNAVVPANNYIIGCINRVTKTLGAFAEFVVNALADMAIGGAQAINKLLEPLNSLISAYNAIAPALGKETIDFELHIPTDGIEETRQKIIGSIRGAVDKVQIKELQELDLDKIYAAIDKGADWLSDFRISDFINDTINEWFGAEEGGSGEGWPYGGDTEKYLGGIYDNTKSLDKSVDMSQEDIKSLVDMAEQRYINNINLQTQAPVINVNGQNTGHTAADRQSFAAALTTILTEQRASNSELSIARAT